METKRIKVIGIGGGGCNVIKQLLKDQVSPENRGICPTSQYIVCNTDIRSLDSVPMNVLSVQIGEHLTRGFGAGGDTRVGERAADEGRFLLKRALKDADLIFITAGLGGGTGTGACPVVARVAKEACPQALVIGVVSTPFAFEGKKRFQLALTGIKTLRTQVDNLVIIDNDRLLEYATGSTPTQRAFYEADKAMAEAISLVVNVINVPGELNVDLQDVKIVLSSLGGTLMLSGRGKTADQAVETAAHLLDLDLSSAHALLFNFKGGPDMTLGHVNDAANLIAKEVDPSALMFFGMSSPSEELRGSVKYTLLASGIEPDLPEAWLPSDNAISPKKK